jgi:spore germination cell wall hydrolase CwlJ-like protein
MRAGFVLAGLAAVAVVYLERRRVRMLLDETGVTGPEAARARAVDTLARTVWAEARGEGYAGMQAVANVVMNRVAFAQARGGYWWGDDVTEVCLKPWQFSCWNPGDPNREKLERVTAVESPIFATAMQIAEYAVDGVLEDITGGATHYHASYVTPGWIDADGATKTANIGAHRFYRGIA